MPAPGDWQDLVDDRHDPLVDLGQDLVPRLAQLAVGVLLETAQREFAEETGFTPAGQIFRAGSFSQRADSPLIDNIPGGPEHLFREYHPTTWPGARLPHVWLDDRTPIQDRIGLALRFSGWSDSSPVAARSARSAW